MSLGSLESLWLAAATACWVPPRHHWEVRRVFKSSHRSSFCSVANSSRSVEGGWVRVDDGRCRGRGGEAGKRERDSNSGVCHRKLSHLFKMRKQSIIFIWIWLTWLSCLSCWSGLWWCLQYLNSEKLIKMQTVLKLSWNILDKSALKVMILVKKQHLKLATPSLRACRCSNICAKALLVSLARAEGL